MRKVLYIDNTAHHAYGQLHNMQALRENGYAVSILIPDDGRYFQKLQSLGYDCISDITSWKGQNPVQELLLLLHLKKVINAIKPELICTFTIKPNLYTAIVIKGTPIKQIANITGLGYAFMSGSMKAKLFSLLYRYALKSVNHIFFQNSDDYSFLLQSNIITKERSVIVLPGSGVDLNKYTYTKMKASSKIKFLYSGRIIGDKGINELIQAFCNVRQKYPNTELIFIGNLFPANPSAINENQIQEWVDAGIIKYLGMVDNVAEIISNCDCMILPSYREGMPRSILEASSIGRPVITVDSIGCKDAVDDTVTGFIAKVKDVGSLTDTMIRFIELPFAEKEVMGKAGRLKMEREFDQCIVIDKYIEITNKLLA